MSSSLVKVLVHKDNKVVQELPISALKKISIGRREDADWVIEHPSGSRQHASIELNTTGLFVTDLGSAHGTCKNGQKIPAKTAIQCKGGDELTFGGSTRKYIIVMGNPKPASNPSSVSKESEKKPVTAAAFCPWGGGRGSDSGGLNTSGNLGTVLAMMGDQKRDSGGGKRSRDDEDEAGVVGRYVKQETSTSGGGGLEGMARRMEQERGSKR